MACSMRSCKHIGIQKLLPVQLQKPGGWELFKGELTEGWTRAAKEGKVGRLEERKMAVAMQRMARAANEGLGGKVVWCTIQKFVHSKAQRKEKKSLRRPMAMVRPIWDSGPGANKASWNLDIWD
eukprot:1146653-Pelagomonas_calceolata.AAC.2